MNFLLLIPLVLIFIVFLTSFGFFLLNKIKLEGYDKISSLLGLSIVIFFSNIFYFFLNFSISVITLIFIFCFFASFHFNLKSSNNRFYNVNISNFFLSIPIIFFFSLLALIYGEKFYIFRGNYWDYFFYIKQALLISDNNFKDLKNKQVRRIEQLQILIKIVVNQFFMKMEIIRKMCRKW